MSNKPQVPFTDLTSQSLCDFIKSSKIGEEKDGKLLKKENFHSMTDIKNYKTEEKDSLPPLVKSIENSNNTLNNNKRKLNSSRKSLQLIARPSTLPEPLIYRNVGDEEKPSNFNQAYKEYQLKKNYLNNSKKYTTLPVDSKHKDNIDIRFSSVKTVKLKEPTILTSPVTNIYCCIDFSSIPRDYLNEEINSPPIEYYKQSTKHSKRKTLYQSLNSNKNNTWKNLMEIMVSKYFYFSEMIDLIIRHLVKEEYRNKLGNCVLLKNDQEVPSDRVICSYFKRKIPLLKIEPKERSNTNIRVLIEGTSTSVSIEVNKECTAFSANFKILKKIEDQNNFHLLGGKPHLYQLCLENTRLGVRNYLKNNSIILSQILNENKFCLVIFGRKKEVQNEDSQNIILRIIDESECKTEEISFNLNISVKQALIKCLKFFPSEKSEVLDDYGLYYPPTSSKNGYFLSLRSPLNCCRLKQNDVIELKKRHLIVPILLPNGEEIIYKSDHETSVQDCLNWIGFNFHLQMTNLALFVPNNGPMVNPKRSLLSALISKSGFVLKKRLEGILIFFGDVEKFIDVSFDIPFRDLLSLIFSQFGILFNEKLNFSITSLSFGIELNLAQSLLEQNISFNSSIILKLLDDQDIPPIDPIVKESIWNEKETPKFSETSSIVYPIAANLNQLIIQLTKPEKTHIGFVHAFLMTFRSFTTPKLLFLKLVERFLCPHSEPNSSIISRKVISFLKKWLAEYPQDFDHTLSQQIVDFVDDILVYRNRKNALIFRKFILQRSCRLKLNFRVTPNYSSKIGMNNLFSLSSIFQFDDESIAIQLTLLDFHIYKLITPLELLGQSWNKEKKRHLSPNINALIDRFNKLTMWVSTLIVHPMLRKERAKRWCRLIKIATHLRKLNNYFSLMAFISGMSQFAVTRLKFTLKTSKDLRSSMKQLQELEALMDSSYSFRNYRSAIANIQGPCVICLSTELKDITFIEDGNPDFVDNNLINFAKQMLLFESISKFLSFQQYDYPHAVDENISMNLRDIFYLGESELYELSLKREPKGAEKSSIL